MALAVSDDMTHIYSGASDGQIYILSFGWLGRAMVLGSFQCWGVLLLWHMVGQGPAVLAVGAGRVGYFSFFYLIYPIFLFQCLISLETAGHTEILWSRPL